MPSRRCELGQLNGGPVRSDSAKGMEKGARGVGDDVGVPGIGLGFTGMQVAIRRIDGPGRHATAVPIERATAIANAPIGGPLIHRHQDPSLAL